MQVFCDFDGTISKRDVTDLVLERFAPPEWHEIEDQWTKGKITSAQCMQRQVRLIRATGEELDAFLDMVEIDDSFIAFKAFCDSKGLNLTVVSDGVDHFIERVLARLGLSGIPVVANKLVIDPAKDDACFDLDFPFINAACAAGSGVCKCNVVAPSGDDIYVGDGRSDFCVSNEAVTVFAKAKLADYCHQRRIPFIPYGSFADVQAAVAGILSSPPRQPFALSVAKSA
ncbi:MtnX-like HAD-IB family phosphatase [Rhizobium sp. 2MFCol3.1]|uniref:MtnX-like HAD-IB family phosphatase n=1 Tax=Rhizobium sp. 2MFCol3.1 TaxID=1246459 RepID=UPI00037F71D4|nr:MtnX-like HAD-IB family phosphatase [Rhizobium sp. 2MFCol3.1]